MSAAGVLTLASAGLERWLGKAQEALIGAS
jgi:hypothetical protein